MTVNSSNATQQSGSGSLTDILTSLQQGVVAINNLTIAMKTVFPSSS